MIIYDADGWRRVLAAQRCGSCAGLRPQHSRAMGRGEGARCCCSLPHKANGPKYRSLLRFVAGVSQSEK